jgi:hypothetical protein
MSYLPNEGNVAFGDINCTIYSKQTGQTATANGESWHTFGQDGTPSRFLGYRFENGRFKIAVDDQGPRPHLLILNLDGDVIAAELGDWRD